MHLIEEMRTVSCILKEIHLYLLLLLSHKYITIYVHVVAFVTYYAIVNRIELYCHYGLLQRVQCSRLYAFLRQKSPQKKSAHEWSTLEFCQRGGRHPFKCFRTNCRSKSKQQLWIFTMPQCLRISWQQIQLNKQWRAAEMQF